MSPAEPTELSLQASREDALQAVLAALPEDAVVRDEDDGVGRFAGLRSVAIIAMGRKRLMLFEGTWGELKGRLEEPQVDVVFGGEADAATVRISKTPDKQPGLGSHVGNFLNQAITVAALIVGYHFVRSIPVDYAFVAGVSVAGGLAWSVVVRLLPKKEARGLDRVVVKALEPLVAGGGE